MSVKAWKDREINTLLTESWGLKMDLEALAEESGVEEEELSAGQAEQAKEMLQQGLISKQEYEEILNPGLKSDRKAAERQALSGPTVVSGITEDQIREAARRVLTRLKETKKNG